MAMSNGLTMRSSHCWFMVFLLFSVPVLAKTLTPSQEFWQYMNDFGDENGDVIDPLEYSQIVNGGHDVAENAVTKDTVESLDAPMNNETTTNIDMKIDKISTHASSSEMKRPSL